MRPSCHAAVWDKSSVCDRLQTRQLPFALFPLLFVLHAAPTLRVPSVSSFRRLSFFFFRFFFRVPRCCSCALLVFFFFFGRLRWWSLTWMHGAPAPCVHRHCLCPSVVSVSTHTHTYTWLFCGGVCVCVCGLSGEALLSAQERGRAPRTTDAQAPWQRRRSRRWERGKPDRWSVRALSFRFVFLFFPRVAVLLGAAPCLPGEECPGFGRGSPVSTAGHKVMAHFSCPSACCSVGACRPRGERVAAAREDDSFDVWFIAERRGTATTKNEKPSKNKEEHEQRKASGKERKGKRASLKGGGCWLLRTLTRLCVCRGVAAGMRGWAPVPCARSLPACLSHLRWRCVPLQRWSAMRSTRGGRERVLLSCVTQGRTHTHALVPSWRLARRALVQVANCPACFSVFPLLPLLFFLYTRSSLLRVLLSLFLHVFIAARHATPRHNDAVRAPLRLPRIRFSLASSCTGQLKTSAIESASFRTLAFRFYSKPNNNIAIDDQRTNTNATACLWRTHRWNSVCATTTTVTTTATTATASASASLLRSSSTSSVFCSYVINSFFPFLSLPSPHPFLFFFGTHYIYNIIYI